MYNNLLVNVISAIQKTGEKTQQEKMDDFHAMLFTPEAYERKLRKEQRREEIRNKLIIAATGLAVVGEIAQMAKHSETVRNIIKKR